MADEQKSRIRCSQKHTVVVTALSSKLLMYAFMTTFKCHWNEVAICIIGFINML